MSKERLTQFFLKKPTKEESTEATGLGVKRCNRGEGDPCPLHGRIHRGSTGRTRRLLELQKRQQDKVGDKEGKPPSVSTTIQFHRIHRIEFVQTGLPGTVVSKPEIGSERIRVVSGNGKVVGKLPRVA